MKNNKGFQLVELIVVIAIMAILAAVAIPTFSSFITKANEASDEDFANGIEYAVNLALTEDGDEAKSITVVMDKGTKKIEALKYTLEGASAETNDDDVTYVVIAATGETVNADAEIVKMITTTIDANYELKTDGPVSVGVVTVTVATE